MPRRKGYSAKKEDRITDFGSSTAYASFDDSHFENKRLPEMLDDDLFKSLFAQKTRFNQALSSQASTELSSHTTLLFGAANRVKPLSANPFSIDFEIPPLPRLDSEQEFSIMTSLVGKPAKDFKKPGSPENRRVIKQKVKEEGRKIWDLMHLVNEDLLDHNLKAESGIQRLWEDGSLDVRLRDMRISEVGLMLPQKCQQIQNQYHQTTA